MAKQILLNRGFENELFNFQTRGTVTINSEIAHSGMRSALLLANPTLIAELSQIVFFITPGTPLRFSFRARKYRSEDVQCSSSVRSEVNFLSALGTVIPPGMVINIRSRNLSRKRWNYYDEYGEVPAGAVAAQVVIRLEKPATGTSGILVDDLALVAGTVTPAALPPIPLAPPIQSGIPFFQG
ncbi:hypothetical protein [Desulfoscipio geothermicus]|uniref:Purine-nucleoside phosphorylase n=1 Tax=Desulfoscipio geothermicus DSM 3669 TaxID=1121426 RepID=A0A1I6DZS7_9FIRM|nr:hypothetical protein [Desulfoscipio geothermicus]SFR10877.1 purine-nucleoside phosphorylase [Desulfoscipio geothermicus DSM 3669]